MNVNTDQNLFSYGTLQHDDVQLATFGRRLEGRQDALVGYRIIMIEVRDPAFVAKAGAMQRSLKCTGNNSDIVEGAVLKLTLQELELADTYEPAEYKRKLVPLKSGTQAWVYLTDVE